MEKAGSHQPYEEKEHLLVVMNEYESLCSRRNGLFASKALYTRRHIANAHVMTRD